jgi:diacylglycerol kinase (ATP)
MNPAAGSVADVEAILACIARFLPDAATVQTKRPEDFKRFTTKALEQGCDTIVAAGGDGTLNGVLNALGDRMGDVRLGLLPLGTGNDFARSVNIPTDVEHAVAVLRENRAQEIDVIRVKRGDIVRYMLNVSAGGFSSKVSELADSDLKDTWGPLCYARSLIGALPQLDDYHTEIRLDDQEVVRTPAYNVVIANARYVAGGIPIAPEAMLDDGLADVVILPVASLKDLAGLAPSTLLGKHLTSDRIIFRRARKVEITSEPAMRFNTDGELLPPGPISFDVLPGAIHFIVGPQPAQDAQPVVESEPILARVNPSTPVR